LGWKKSGSGSVIRNEDLRTFFRDPRNSFSGAVKILKFFDADPDPGYGIFLTLDPGWKNLDPGSGIKYKY
jgi:hypothetical protein